MSRLTTALAGLQIAGLLGAAVAFILHTRRTATPIDQRRGVLGGLGVVLAATVGALVVMVTGAFTLGGPVLLYGAAFGIIAVAFGGLLYLREFDWLTVGVALLGVAIGAALLRTLL